MARVVYDEKYGKGEETGARELVKDKRLWKLIGKKKWPGKKALGVTGDAFFELANEHCDGGYKYIEDMISNDIEQHKSKQKKPKKGLRITGLNSSA